MKRILLSLFVCLTFAGAAKADIFDRIDRCEQNGGGGGCVYDLLRELAQNGGGTAGILENGVYVSNSGPATIYANANAISLKWRDANVGTDGSYACTGFVCTHIVNSNFKITVSNPTTFTLTISDGFVGTFTKQ